MELSNVTPSLVASTSDTYCCSIPESHLRESKLQDGHEPVETTSNEADKSVNYFKSAQWSPDGTTLLTSSADDTLRTFILPPNLLSSPDPIVLTPYTTHNFPTSINTLTPYPYYSLSDTSTTLLLSTPTALPIRLTNTLSTSPAPLSTYPLVCPTTEAYLTPSSILWSSPGTHFLTGTDCLIALFDISRNGQGPVTRLPTIPSKRHKMKGGGVGMRGIVSALSLQPGEGDGMLAAGTWTRWVGLYDAGGLGGTVATWSIAEAADKNAGIGGSGVTQTLWSACGRYLYVVERKSQGVLVFDVRVTGKLVAWLEGREADTNQRLGVDVFEGPKGPEIWAGGTDGVVRIWETVGQTEGGAKSNWSWKAHDDHVTSTTVHSSGTVVATCSGQRPEYDIVNDDDSSSESESGESDSDSDSDNDSDSSSSSQSRTNSILNRSTTSASGQRRSPETMRKTPDNSIKVWSL